MSASGVLASLRGSRYGASTTCLFARCGLAGRLFLRILRVILTSTRHMS